jgi:hypothetical protein
MSGHTPGPWHWSDRYRDSHDGSTWSLCGDDGFGILSCDGDANSPQNVNIADAHLIAAAPDMFAALYDLIVLASAAMTFANRDGAEFNVELELQAAHAVLAKAEGKS